jgi:hypothetical protein
MYPECIFRRKAERLSYPIEFWCQTVIICAFAHLSVGYMRHIPTQFTYNQQRLVGSRSNLSPQCAQVRTQVGMHGHATAAACPGVSSSFLPLCSQPPLHRHNWVVFPLCVAFFDWQGGFPTLLGIYLVRVPHIVTSKFDLTIFDTAGCLSRWLDAARYPTKWLCGR